MTRVLHIVMGMNRGGLETFIMNVYRNIDRNKVQFDFLVHTSHKCSYDDEIFELGGKIYAVPSRKEGFIGNRKGLDSFFFEHREYSIVHQHVSSLSYIAPLFAAKRHGVKNRIVHSHSSSISGNKLNYVAHHINKLAIMQNATHYFACSKVAGEWLLGKNSAKEGKFCVVYNGIDVEKFSFSQSVRTNIRRSLNFTDNYVIGHVGRFSYPKNHAFLVRVFREVLSVDSTAKLLLVGDGVLRKEIGNLVSEMGLSNSVTFLGERSDISDLLQAMDVFVYPSHYEGLPVSLIEAQTSGLPCVISDNITSEVCVTNEIVSMPLSFTPMQWANKVLSLNHTSSRSSHDEEISNAGYNVKVVAKDLEDFYLSL